MIPDELPKEFSKGLPKITSVYKAIKKVSESENINSMYYRQFCEELTTKY